MRRPLRTMLTSALVGGALAVGGCGVAHEPELAPEAAEALQDAVHAVAVAAAQGRHDAAAAALTDVRAALDAAVENDDVTVQRYREIDTAIQRTEELLAVEQTTEAAGDEPEASTD